MSADLEVHDSGSMALREKPALVATKPSILDPKPMIMRKWR